METIEITPRVNLHSFKSDLSKNDIKKLLFDKLQLSTAFQWNPFLIDTLSIAKTIGKGRTNLTLIRPDIVQADSATPFASFNLTTGQRQPVAQFHFRPDAYGITQTSNYVASFVVDCPNTCIFNLSGFAGAGTIANAGLKTITGRRTVSVVIKNLPASQDMYAALTQQSGTAWSFYEVRISFPQIILTQP